MLVLFIAGAAIAAVSAGPDTPDGAPAASELTVAGDALSAHHHQTGTWPVDQDQFRAAIAAQAAAGHPVNPQRLAGVTYHLVDGRPCLAGWADTTAVRWLDGDVQPGRCTT